MGRFPHLARHKAPEVPPEDGWGWVFLGMAVIPMVFLPWWADIALWAVMFGLAIWLVLRRCANKSRQGATCPGSADHRHDSESV